MANEDFTTYTEADPNTRITKTSSKVTWTALTNGEKAWVAKDMGASYFNGDFIHQFECEFSGQSGTPVCIFWAVANGSAFRDRADSGLGWYISFAWEYFVGLGYGFHLKCHRWANGPTDRDSWVDESPSTRYYITIQHDWDGGVNNTGRTTAWIRTGSHGGEVVATLSVDRGVGGQLAMDYIYACQTQDDEGSAYMSGFTENLNLSASLPPNYKLLAGTCAIESTATGATLKRSRALAGITAIESVTAGALGRTRSVSRTTAIVSTTTGELTKTNIKALAGVVVISCTTSGVLKAVRKIAGTVTIESTAIAELSKTGLKELAGICAIESATAGALKLLMKIAGVAAIACTTAGELTKGEIKELAGLVEISTITAGELTKIGFVELAGVSVIKSTAAGLLVTPYVEIPPFMEEDLIDPYASGAWLWLVQIAVPTKDTVHIARNTEDVHYDGNDFEKFNLEIGAQTFSGDGSIPRVTLRTFQDATRQIENIINETEGALGGAVKLIRVNEKWLTSPVAALEADYDLLASQSDSEWCTITLGIPNPLTQRYPLRDFSSSVCPWTSPELYKGPECQCVHADTTCTGTYDDCLSKGNETRWGGELGLSPSVIKERRQ